MMKVREDSLGWGVKKKRGGGGVMREVVSLDLEIENEKAISKG